jgi:signal peptidase II
MQAARGASLTRRDPEPSRIEPPRTRRVLLLFCSVALGVYLLDLATKSWAVRALADRPPVQVVGDLLQLDLVFNPGAAFSTGTGYTVVLTFVAITAVGVVLWTARRLANPLWAIGLGFLLGGVLGNLTDRLFRPPGFLRGHVVDFIRLPDFPVFNVADMAINVAAAVIIVQALRGVTVAGARADDDRAGDRPGNRAGDRPDDRPEPGAEQR